LDRLLVVRPTSPYGIARVNDGSRDKAGSGAAAMAAAPERVIASPPARALPRGPSIRRTPHDPLLGKTVIVTGAATGIGAATARRFSEEGANVIVNGRRADALNQSVAALPAARTLAHPGDASDSKVCAALVQAAVERFGGLHVLVNNAAVYAGGDIESTSEADFRQVMDVNVGGYFLLAKAAMPELKKSRGSIVMTSSVSGIGGDWNQFAYNTSKGAVSNMVRAMALDHGKDGVRVNAVNPQGLRMKSHFGFARSSASIRPGA